MQYGVKCNIGEEIPYTLSNIEIDDVNGHLFDFVEKKNGLNMQVYLSEIKPYLFPMSSMTEKQKEKLHSLMIHDAPYGLLYHTLESFDYLYKNHIDVRGLISKGLAIDATDKNIY